MEQFLAPSHASVGSNDCGANLRISVGKGSHTYEGGEEHKTAMEALWRSEPAILQCADHSYLEHRQHFVDWVDVMCEHLRLQGLTVHYAVHYLDRVCFGSAANFQYMHYIAAACVLIAAKFEETPNDTPLISHIIEIARPEGLQPDVLAEIEIMVLQRLDWKLRIATGYHFISEHKKWGMFPKDDSVVIGDESLPPTDHDKLQACKYVKYFCELALRDARFLKHRVSISAAAAWAAGRAFADFAPVWPESLAMKTGHSKDEILSCYQDMFAAFKDRHPERGVEEPPLLESTHEETTGSPTDVTDHTLWKAMEANVQGDHEG